MSHSHLRFHSARFLIHGSIHTKIVLIVYMTPPLIVIHAHKGQHALKRGLDFFVSLTLLIILGPLLLLIAAFVKLTSPGPVLFPCHWVGQNARRFTGYKFRTMVSGAHLMEASLKSQNEMQGPAFKLTNDPRVTPLGRFLRKHSLDEFPQLWSVLIGDLSLVGPRPPREHEYAQFTDFQKRKLEVKPGITCLWQVQGRHKISDYDDWVRLDLKYIEEWSLWLDIKILAKTALVVLRGTGI
jgi:lipopolysaccharide/colanic/teichoic acid biosynthesis glycosyltransferase